MEALWKQFHKGTQFPIPSGDVTALAKIRIVPGSYIVSAKMDIMAQSNSDGLASVQVALRFKDHGGSMVEDETIQQWANPRNSNHRTENIILNIGFNFEPTIGEFGSSLTRLVELVAFANRDGVISASNLTITAITVDKLVDDFVI
jgi:hypothetical protein